MGIPASLFVQLSMERPKGAFCPGRPVHSVPGGLEFPPCSLCPDLGGLAPPLWKSPRDRAGKPLHKQRAAKNRRFFDGHGRAIAWCRKPQKDAPQIWGDSKGPSLWRIFLHTFCASRKYGPRRASSQSPLCLGLPSVALGPLPCSSFPQQTHFVGLCRGPHFPLGSGKNAVGDTSPLTLRGNPLQ